jgi:hypothetical protein
MLWDESIKTNNLITKIPDDPTWNNVNNNTLDKILNGDWYTNIEDYWNSSSDKFIKKCVQSCAFQGQLKTEFKKHDD